MINVSEIILIGGGNSISEGIFLNLKEKLGRKFVIAINYAYKHFPHTCMIFGDENFYFPQIAKSQRQKYPDIYEELKKESLIFYQNDKNKLKEYQLPNTIYLKSGETYNTNPLKQGFYKHWLTGIFTLSLAQFLIGYNGTIFLLGYDFGTPNRNNKETHYYSDKEINHKGVHRTDVYSARNPTDLFGQFKEPNIKIYNISPLSNIPCFEKINYSSFFYKLSDVVYNQDELRQYILKKLKGEQ